MYSFYGGKQGRTYHIVQRFDCVNINNFDIDFADILIKSDDTGETGKFKVDNLTTDALVKNVSNSKYYRIIKQPASISDVFTSQYSIELQLKGMVQQFRKGGNYTTVNYGQYVIIDTVKNLGQHTNDENGLLFRRGFDYLETGSQKPNKTDAAYHTIDDIAHTDIFNENKWQDAWSNWIENVGGGAIYVGQIVGPIGKAGQLDAVKWSDLGISEDQAIELDLTRAAATPGSQNFQDYILFGVAQVKAANGDITGHKISFDFVKPVINIQAKNVSPYGEKTLVFIDPITTESDPQIINFDNNHQSNQLIKEHNDSLNHPFYYSYQIAVPQGIKGQSVDSLNIVTGDDISEDAPDNINNEYTYLTYKLTTYENSQNGVLSGNKYLSPYNIIKGINQNNKVHEVIQLTNNQTITSTSIKIGSLAKGTGDNWNNNLYLVCTKLDNKIESYIPNNDIVPQSGKIYQKDNDPYSAVWQCIELPSNSVLTDFVITFTAQEDSEPFIIRNIDYLYMDQYGDLFIKYSDTNIQPIKIGHIPIIKNIGFANFEDSAENNSMFYTETSTSSQSFEKVNISTEINYPIDIKRVGDLMYVLYSSQKYRNELKQAGKTRSLEYKDGRYQDYRVFELAPGGYHTLGDVSLEDLIQGGVFAEGIENYHKPGEEGIYPYEERSGWTVSVFDESANQYIFYTYDYLDTSTSDNPKHTITINGQNYQTRWYQVETKGNIDLSTYYMVDIQGNIDAQTGNPLPNDSIKSEQLKESGIWFIREN